MRAGFSSKNNTGFLYRQRQIADSRTRIVRAGLTIPRVALRIGDFGASSRRPSRMRAAPATLLASFSEVSVVAVVWNIEIAPEQGEAFERFYGADGEWTALSRKSRSFLGSSFLRDLAHVERYLLIEYWSEMLVYERHLADFGDEVQTLEAQRDRFVVRLEALGVFSALDVPDRVGPTWSRRSG